MPQFESDTKISNMRAAVIAVKTVENTDILGSPIGDNGNLCLQYVKQIRDVYGCSLYEAKVAAEIIAVAWTEDDATELAAKAQIAGSLYETRRKRLEGSFIGGPQF